MGKTRRKIFLKMKSRVIRIRDQHIEKLKEIAIKESCKRGEQITAAQLADEILCAYINSYVDLDRETFNFAESNSDNK